MMGQIPDHLQLYIVQQDPGLYTPMDHASWRFIMKLSQKFFASHAYHKYLNGLKETGISTERIPLIEEMNQCLRKFHWQAVAVTGFIPPSVFMEFLSLGVLPIACDMRTLDHLDYTPAPDIVHEAAGHAPIIADPEYADYLRSYGEISRKAIFSSQDMNVYQAIRHLSDIKEDPNSTFSQVDAAEARLKHALEAVTEISEATLLSRMGWWTFEYGLIEDPKEPKIFGAGLLSSLGESFHCFDPQVKKIPFSMECIETAFDITRPQPQLFVAKNFQQLKKLLFELADRMAFRRGGIEGLKKAKSAKTVTTTQLDTGIQISGVLVGILQDESEMPRYLQFDGPTQLSYQDCELSGQGALSHQQGYGTPLEDVTQEDLRKFGVTEGKRVFLRFSSGTSVEGKCTRILRQGGRPILLSFENCTVQRGAEILFRPEWGTYDMACGSQVVSVFGGAADRRRYLEATGQLKADVRHQKTNLTEENEPLNELYQKVRQVRESQLELQMRVLKLQEVVEALGRRFPGDWLLRLELLELVALWKLSVPWEHSLRQRLREISCESSQKSEMIRRGLEWIEWVSSS
ncbi:MAG: aromatic amino acid hydroxylase [Bdellovibrionia bacterium]